MILLPWLVHQEGSLGKDNPSGGFAVFVHWICVEQLRKLDVANDEDFFSQNMGNMLHQRYGMCVLK